MNKKKLIAASIAFALAGCGGDDSSSPSGGTVSAGGVIVITGVDGYYQNALVFDDTDNDGVLDVGSDAILGLTNSLGQLTYNYSGDLDSVLQGSIALQTLVPGGDKQQELIAYDADTYSGVYTIDTDYSDTALDTEMVLRAPTSSVAETDEHEDDDESYTAVVSPISDLVSIQIESGQSEDEAESAVATALGVNADKLYSDYADDDTGDATTQKKAQILAESKAYAISEGEDYDASATDVAEQTASTVSSMSTADINDDTVVPVVIIESESGSAVITVETNTVATVNGTLFDEIQDELSALDTTGEINWSKDVSGLFSDSDQTSLTILLSDIPDADETGITVALDGNTLQVTATEVLSTDDVTFNLYIEDKTSEATTIGSAIASFTMSNSAPTADSTEYSELQTTINAWSITAGEEFSSDFSIADLFNDEDSDTLSYTFSPNTVNGLTITEEGETVTVSGTPVEDTVTEDTEGTVYEFTVIASDGKKYADVTFTLPDILEADTDGDGVVDSEDAFPEDATETTDSDGDGVGDNSDAFPNDASEDTDTDGDGVGDNSDAFPEDATETTDSDDDGYGDAEDDAFPEDATEWLDSDGDGYGDNEDDAFPNDATEWADSDGDGIGDNSDPDNSTELSASDFENQRYYVLWARSNAPHNIMTLLFSSEGESIETGYGYIDEGEEDYLDLATSWEIIDGDIVFTDWDARFSLHERGSDYLKVCYSSDVDTSATCTDDTVEIFYSNKDAAQTYVTENSSDLTDIDLSSITDTALNSYFTDLEYDYAEQVYTVVIEDLGVESLEGMAQFSNLTELRAGDNHISDISPLSGLTSMDYLYLEDQTDADTDDDLNLTSYTPIMSMTSLTRLVLSEHGDTTPVGQFDLAGFIDNHTDKSSITRLSLYGVEIDNEDVDAIVGMPNLTNLSLTDISGVDDLTGLEANDWSNLTSLILNGNNDDIDDEELSLYPEFNLDNMILAGLNLAQLDTLELAKTSLSADDITTIASGIRTNLEWLNLRTLPTSDYSGLFENLAAPNLRSLKIGRHATEDSDFDMADIADNLTPSALDKRLYLDDGNISNFAIEEFTTLERLRLSGSNITDTTIDAFETALNSLTGLEELDIGGDFSIQGINVYCSDLSLNDSIECEDSGDDYTSFGSHTDVWDSDDFIELVQDYADANGYQFPGIHNLVDNYADQFELTYSSAESGYYFVFLSDGTAAYGTDRDSLTEAKWTTESDDEYGYQLVTVSDADDEYVDDYSTLFQFVLLEDEYNEESVDFTDLAYHVSMALYDATDNTAEKLTLEVANADTDEDGTYNDTDTDDDGDGTPDDTDSFPLDASESADTDGDGVGDNSDNCVDTSNSAQSDADGDGIGDMCETPDADDIATASSFVTDVRTAYASVEDGGDLSTGLDSFSTELDAIDDLVTDDIDTVTTNVALAVDAIAEAVDDEVEVTAFPYTAENDVVVSLSGNVYSVTSPAEVTATVTQFDFESSETEIDYSADCPESDPCTAGEDFSADVNLSIDSISATSNDVTLTGSGTAVVENLVSTSDESYVNESSNSFEEEESFTADNIEIILTDATLTYADAEFTGSIQIAMEDLEQLDSNSWGYNTDTGSESLSYLNASLVIDGDLTSTDSSNNTDSLGVYLSISIDNSLGYTESSSWGYTWDSINDQFSNAYSESEETEDSYIKFDVTARVTTDVANAANEAVAASVELVAEREEFDSMDVQITVDYNDVDTIISATYGLYSDDISDITISNDTGSEIVLTDIDNIIGTIYVNGVAVATINGDKITYSDGTFDSLY